MVYSYNIPNKYYLGEIINKTLNISNLDEKLFKLKKMAYINNFL